MKKIITGSRQTEPISMKEVSEKTSEEFTELSVVALFEKGKSIEELIEITGFSEEEIREMLGGEMDAVI